VSGTALAAGSSPFFRDFGPLESHFDDSAPVAGQPLARHADAGEEPAASAVPLTLVSDTTFPSLPHGTARSYSFVRKHPA
jgi:hypothetical protein